MTVHHAASVDHAIELAEGFKRSGEYDLFRGQVHPWQPQTSLHRLQIRRPTDWKECLFPRLARFREWCAKTAELVFLASPKNVHQFGAVLQHYGVETPYLDFSTDPAVAGFFATDGTPPPGSTHACIYMLKREDVFDFFETLNEDRRETTGDDVPLVEIVEIDVSDLWRLQAQHGLFICARTNWYDWYPPDRILFPHSGPPSYPTRSVIYPTQKSRLEIAVDGYFAEERSMQSSSELLEEFTKLKIPIISIETPESGYRPHVARGGELRPHSSWEKLEAWQRLPNEDIRKMHRRVIPLHLDWSAAPIAIRASLLAGISRVLRSNPGIRDYLVDWEFPPPPSHVNIRRLLARMGMLWDGLRSLPYSDDQVAAALALLPALCMLGVDSTLDGHGELKMIEILLGESIEVDLGRGVAADNRGYVSLKTLHRALRPDAADVFAADIQLGPDNLKQLLLAIVRPSLLFSHDAFADVFVREIVPTQMLRWREGDQLNAFFFAPALLERFGIP